MEVFNSYLLIIAVSGILIISYFFNVFSKKTNILAVLMLIGHLLARGKFIKE